MPLKKDFKEFIEHAVELLEAFKLVDSDPKSKTKKVMWDVWRTQDRALGIRITKSVLSNRFVNGILIVRQVLAAIWEAVKSVQQKKRGVSVIKLQKKRPRQTEKIQHTLKSLSKVDNKSNKRPQPKLLGVY